MKISDFSVKNYQFTVVLFAMLVALGLNSWFAIPRAEDPTFPVPVYSVVAVYPGASPTDVEQLVVEPIEEQLGELDDLEDLEAEVRDGLAVIRAEFETSVDADRKYDEVVREVNALRPSLPADLRTLEVRKTTSADVNIVQIALVSEVAPYHMLDALAKRLEGRIEAVPGVRGAERWGAPDREIQVSLDLGRLSQIGIPASRVIAAIGSDNANIPGGSLDVGARRFNVKSSGEYETPDEVRATVIGVADGQIVRVGDVATVEWGYADATHVTRYNGRRAVLVTATQQDGYNIATVRDGI
ncbi:MAG TPA: efflux RND transporter permease subunit, partial [Gemmatimonadaceae bacterium]|nr:efflux RND transporter permease subunit [Gemmatimonadaceae bacterium]